MVSFWFGSGFTVVLPRAGGFDEGSDEADEACPPAVAMLLTRVAPLRVPEEAIAVALEALYGVAVVGLPDEMVPPEAEDDAGGIIML